MAAPADDSGWLRQAMRRFRRWRHNRPFWGALFLTLGGLEIFLSEQAPLPLVIHIGVQGVAGYLVPVIMVLLGLLLMFHPEQRTFYSLLGIILALASWITSNLGGFFIGMILGVVGGSLGFAWGRRPGSGQSQAPARPQPSRPTGLTLVRGWHTEEETEEADQGAEAGAAGSADNGDRASQPDAGEHSDPGEQDPPRETRPAPSRRTPPETGGPPGSVTVRNAAIAPIAALMLAGAMAASPSLGSSPSPNPSGSPTASASGSPSPSASPTASPSGSPSASPTSSPSGSPSPAPSQSPSPAPSATASPRPTASHSSRVHRSRTALGAPVVAADGSSLTAAFAILTGITYSGITTERTDHGTRALLVFKMSSLTLPASVLRVTQSDHSTITSNSTVTLSGNVSLYATKISGLVRGVRVTYTEASPPTGVHRDMTLTNVTAAELFAVAKSETTSTSSVIGS